MTATNQADQSLILAAHRLTTGRRAQRLTARWALDPHLRGWTPPELLAALPDWPTADRFDARDRAVLALTEQFVIDVANIDDALLAQARAHLGDGLADFLNALLVTEQRQRLSLAWERLLV